MMKCFVCGREYDENNRPVAVRLFNKETGETENIKSISDGENDKVLALCHFCTKASVIGGIMTISGRTNYKLKDVSIIYENT